MNRNRKSTDLIHQLGEPLPLPYRPSANIVKEETEENSPEDPPATLAEPIRRRHFAFRRQLEDSKTESPQQVPLQVPLPLWRNHALDETTESTILDSIEKRVEQLRRADSSESRSKLEQIDKQLEEIDKQLEELLQKQQEGSIVQELERLQQMADVPRKERKLHVLIIVVAALAIAALTSLFLSNLTYDYCYYFC